MTPERDTLDFLRLIGDLDLEHWLIASERFKYSIQAGQTIRDWSKFVYEWVKKGCPNEVI